MLLLILLESQPVIGAVLSNLRGKDDYDAGRRIAEKTEREVAKVHSEAVVQRAKTEASIALEAATVRAKAQLDEAMASDRAYLDALSAGEERTREILRDLVLASVEDWGRRQKAEQKRSFRQLAAATREGANNVH
jgi:hypothetical protein